MTSCTIFASQFIVYLCKTKITKVRDCRLSKNFSNFDIIVISWYFDRDSRDILIFQQRSEKMVFWYYQTGIWDFDDVMIYWYFEYHILILSWYQNIKFYWKVSRLGFKIDILIDIVILSDISKYQTLIIRLEIWIIYTLFLYKNIFYKNIEAEISEILRINPRLGFWKGCNFVCWKSAVNTLKLYVFNLTV